MTSRITQTLAATVLGITLASGAYAGTHPCRTEHQNAKAACASDRHSTTCKQAHKAVKACRIANGLPVKGKGGTAATTASGPGTAPVSGGTSGTAGATGQPAAGAAR